MVSRDSLKRLASKVLLVLLLSAPTPVFADQELVLIVSTNSNIDRLDSASVRKLFLGLAVAEHGQWLRPLLNESEQRVKELFLQNVISMSDSIYDRYVLRLSLTHGQSRPPIYKSAAQLVDAVAADPDAVGYVWARDVVHDGRVRILRVLWHD